MTELRIARAQTRAMFCLGEQGLVAGALEDSANLLFADTVKREGYARARTGANTGLGRCSQKGTGR